MALFDVVEEALEGVAGTTINASRVGSEAAINQLFLKELKCMSFRLFLAPRATHSRRDVDNTMAQVFAVQSLILIRIRHQQSMRHSN
jgi:hypothetical protein